MTTDELQDKLQWILTDMNFKAPEQYQWCLENTWAPLLQNIINELEADQHE